MQRLFSFAKDTVLNFLTVLPAFIVAILVDNEGSKAAYMLGLVLGIFIILLVIQVVFMAVFRTHRHWVNSTVAMIVMLLTGLLLAGMAFDDNGSSDFTDTELAFILNISTEFLGAAIIVVLLQFKRIGVVVLLAVGTYVFSLLDTQAGNNLSLYTNLSAEIFGALLTGWVIYRVIEFRDRSDEKSKNKET